jgi:hypothetical protein
MSVSLSLRPWTSRHWGSRSGNSVPRPLNPGATGREECGRRGRSTPGGSPVVGAPHSPPGGALGALHIKPYRCQARDFGFSCPTQSVCGRVRSLDGTITSRTPSLDQCDSGPRTGPDRLPPFDRRHGRWALARAGAIRSARGAPGGPVLTGHSSGLTCAGGSSWTRRRPSRAGRWTPR